MIINLVKLYESFDFKRMSAYNGNPLPDVCYMKLDLAARKQTAEA